MTGDAIFAIAYGAFIVLLAVCFVMGQLPRGLRWLWPLTQAIGRALRWLLLRVFYPERLPKKAPCRGKCKNAPNLCNTKCALEPETLDRLEVWHQAYELGHTPKECDGIAAAPEVWDDTARRHGAMNEPTPPTGPAGASLPVNSRRCIDEEVEHEGPHCQCYDAPFVLYDAP